MQTPSLKTIINANETENTSNNVSLKEEDLSTNNTEGSLKEEYLKKINNAKSEAEELEARDSSTYALKRWKTIDGIFGMNC